MGNIIELKLRKPHAAQQAIINSPARFKTVRAGRRFGKSVITQQQGVIRSLEAKHEAFIVPTFKLARYFYKDLESFLPSKLFKFNGTDFSITNINKGSISFFSAEAPDALRSRKFHHIYIDEASFQPNLLENWNNIYRPTLTDYKGGATFISTPRGQDDFYALCQRNDKGWQNFHFSTYDNPHIDPSEIEEAKSQLPEAVFEQEYMANPMANADNPFGTENIKACICPLSTKQPKYWGIDLAKSYDYTVIIGLDEDGNVAYFDRYQKPWSLTKQNILTIPKRAVGFIDATGVGDPIAEEICEVLRGIEAFKINRGNKQNLILGLISSIAQKEIGFPEGVISQELGTFEYTYTPNGTIYQARSGFHDDTTIALAFAVKAFKEKRNFGKYTIH